jgi:2,3-dihydroxybiphenyl 1,2-dioxygenase
MLVQALGYVGVSAKDLGEWAEYGSRFLGLELAERSGSGIAFRMDERARRILVRSDDGPPVFGWEVADGAALDALTARLESAGLAVARGSRSLAGERDVADLVVFDDPLGNRLEVFHGAANASEPFRPGRPISGFRTGALGLGHAVLTVERIETVLPFYRDVLGFRLSDWTTRPFRACFLHVNPRHHSLALIETGKNGLHHLMLEHLMLDDVGQAYDLALGIENRVAVTLGRHVNDFMTSFYARSPSGFLTECGWGGRTIDLMRWQPEEVTAGPSLWGHDRAWLPPELRAEARALRLKAAADGLREPVQVLPGNYEVASHYTKL